MSWKPLSPIYINSDLKKRANDNISWPVLIYSTTQTTNNLEIKTAFKEGLHEEIKCQILNWKIGNVIMLNISRPRHFFLSHFTINEGI